MKITLVTDDQVITGTVQGEPYIMHDSAAELMEYCLKHPEECGRVALPSDRLGGAGGDPRVIETCLPPCTCHGQDACSECCDKLIATQADETLPPCAEGDELHLVLKVTGVMDRNERRSN